MSSTWMSIWAAGTGDGDEVAAGSRCIESQHSTRLFDVAGKMVSTIAERGRIPRSVMERYEADAGHPAASTRRTSRGSSTGRGRRPGRSRSTAA